MSAFLNLTPTIMISIRNPLLGKRFPEDNDESLTSVIDTGYEGFLAVPRDVFKALSFSELQLQRRELILANGETLASEGAYGVLGTQDRSFEAQGLVETYEGLNEVLVGAEALARTRTLLDYCTRKMSVENCR